MKKQNWFRVGGICLIVAAAVIALGELLPMLLLPMLLQMPAAGGDVGIIGGADGPTAVFVATSNGTGPVVEVLAVVVLLVLGIVLLKKSKR